MAKSDIKNTIQNNAKQVAQKATQVAQKAAKDKSSRYLILFAIVFAVVVGRTIYQYRHQITPGSEPAPVVQQLSFSDIANMASEGGIAKITLHGNEASGILKDGSEFKAIVPFDTELLTKLSESGADVSVSNEKSWTDHLAMWVPILMGVIFIWWILRGFGRSGGMPSKMSQYNPTRITTGKTKTTFEDVAGIDEEKSEVQEIVDFLKNPDKFKALGARVPRGILLSGEPGTGKTLLARAIAGEANVPFFATSGSDFAGIIVGLGVAKIKEIFEMAKRNSPSILFIDEIDAIGQKRGRGGFNDQDREQTLNQLLIEMDGFSNESGIIIIGATNRPDMLDTALLRPGRFDRQIYIELPSLKGREDILKLYAKKFKLAKSINLKDVARGTTGFSGADLENLLNEAALAAARLGRKQIEMADIDEARDKNLMGPKKNRKIRDWDKKMTAYHEAGHAFISMHYDDLVDPILKATIIPRGQALGMVQHLPIDDKVSMTVAEIKANMAVAMGGRAAEMVFMGPSKITTGAESDIAKATRLARYSITVAGLSDKIGSIAINQADTFGARHSLETASEKTIQMVDDEIKAWVDAAYSDAIKILTRSKSTVKKLAEELLKRETLSMAEIEKIIRKK